MHPSPYIRARIRQDEAPLWLREQPKTPEYIAPKKEKESKLKEFIKIALSV